MNNRKLSLAELSCWIAAGVKVKDLVDIKVILRDVITHRNNSLVVVCQVLALVAHP